MPGRLDNPTLELFDNNGLSLRFNDNWKQAPNRDQIRQSGLAPQNDREAVILITLPPGVYTSVVRGKDNTIGIGLFEAYDRSQRSDSELANISTRGLIQLDDNVLIGGFIVGNKPGGTRVLIRAIGPSLKRDVPNAMDNPTLELRDGNGDLIEANDNWKDSPDRAEIRKTRAAPKNDKESAIIFNTPAAPYTAIVRGKNNTKGIGLVEIYNVH